MKVVIIFNHPFEGSYCNAILESAIDGLKKANHSVDLIHLDREGFNPVMTAEDLKGFKESRAIDPKVIEYKERLGKAEHLVFIFPIWWELMPAMTKGFIDKVIFPGVAYNYTKKGFMSKSFNRINGITLITTMNTPSFFYRILFGNAIKKAVLFGTFWKTGYKHRKWINLSMVKIVSNKKRKKWLFKIERYFENLAK
ncbi:MAG: NAD(P)H-dependent oxidoreductase [Ignavibacteriaceae bacterium]